MEGHPSPLSPTISSSEGHGFKNRAASRVPVRRPNVDAVPGQDIMTTLVAHKRTAGDELYWLGQWVHIILLVFLAFLIGVTVLKQCACQI
jgi:hypothetical protein